MADTTPNPMKVVTPEVRLAFVHLLEPFSNDPDKDPKYSCVVMIPKTDQATIQRLAAAQQAAAEDGKNKKFGGRIPPNLKSTIHDGDTEMDLEAYPEFAGHYFLTTTANTKFPPQIVDRALNPVLDHQRVYSGVWARVSMVAFAFNTQGNRGISFGLRNVQIVRDGERFSGGASASDDFEALPDEGGQPAAPQFGGQQFGGQQPAALQFGGQQPAAPPQFAQPQPGDGDSPFSLL